mgnify:CR=1 FL=1
MLFTEAQLRANHNPLAILDEATYLTEEEARIHPSTIPVMESPLGVWKVPYHPLEELCEDHGVGLVEAFATICEMNGIDPSIATLAIDEADLIEYPELVNESIPFVVAPISDYDPIYQMYEAAIEEYMETLDDSLLESSLDVNSDMSGSTIFNLLHQKFGSIRKRGLDAVLKATTKSQVDRANQAMQDEINAAGNKAQDALQRGIAKKQAKLDQNRQQRANANPPQGGSGGSSTNSGGGSGRGGLGRGIVKAGLIATGLAAGGTAVAAAGGYGAYKAIQAYRNKPRSVIAKKIASLRKLYAKTMHNFKNASDSGLKNRLKHVAGKILEAIDKLLGFLQRKADGR